MAHANVPLADMTEGEFLRIRSIDMAGYFVLFFYTRATKHVAWVGVKNFGFTEKQKNIEQGSTKLKELHVCIMRVQKKMAAWQSEVP